MNQEKIGKFILTCRKEKKLTQTELAEKLGVTDKSISNWENGRNMPDLSLFKPLCEILNISINDLISGEKISKDKYQEKLEENIITTIDYTNKKVLVKNNIIGIILIAFGVMMAITAMSIFPSESSWGSIYSLFGAFISLVGIIILIKKLKITKKIIISFSYIILFSSLLFIIDYLSVINIKQAPRFSIIKVSSDTAIYYDTLFYDVIRCNKDTKDEYYKIIKNNKYDKDNIQKYCKKISSK
mgnify:FL=1